MEEAIFITGVSGLNDWSARYSRIYFGNEFCQELIPSRKELEEVMDFVLSHNLDFTFVTGLVAEGALSCFQDLLAVISLRLPKSEIVVNDWGMLNIAKSYNLVPVIGRLLTKQRRDPRILNLIQKLPQKAVECLKSAGGGLCLYQFLKKASVSRMEIDNLPQGIILDESAKSEGFHFSLYFPFNYVTTSRQCLFNNACLHPARERLGGCTRKCRQGSMILRHHTMSLPLYMKGNTIFLENRNMPILAQEGIDRIIYQPDIPM